MATSDHAADESLRDTIRQLAAAAKSLSREPSASGEPADRDAVLAAVARLASDIAERAGSETALLVARAEADAFAANGFLNAIIENIPHMIFVKDAERLAFERFNRAGEELLGASRHDLLGKNDYDFFPAEQAAFFQAKDRNTLNSKAVLDIPEEPIQTKHGLRWLHTKKVPILDEHGTPRYLLGISEDITERRAAQEALRRAKEEAEAANRELEAFSYSVAHDLRAPLRAIDGFSQALIEDCAGQLDAEGQLYLKRVRSSALQMAQLIDDLLNLSRMTRSELRRERVDLGLLAHDSISRLRHGSPDRVVDVTIAGDLRTQGDPRLLAVVLDNLLGNAWKFTSKCAEARVELGVEHGPNGHAVYFVRDNGAGFDMAFSNKLFGVFQRLHSPMEFEGTGIGLATVQRVIKRHGGEIWAHGEVGAGATFYFTLEQPTLEQLTLKEHGQ